MFNIGQSNHVCDFLERMMDEVDDSSSTPSVIDSSRIPIMVIQRQKYLDRVHSAEHCSSVDVPHYIWVEQGTWLTPALVSDIVYDSIYHSLTKPKYRDVLKEWLEEQEIISFGTTTDLHRDGVSFSEQRPLMVRTPTCVVLDWNVGGGKAISDMMTSIMKAQDIRAEAVQPPTSLENLLRAYVEEEQLTGANQWRCAHVAVLLPCCASL
jgi:hypothetical protein